jgi:hypothetical protein
MAKVWIVKPNTSNIFQYEGVGMKNGVREYGEWYGIMARSGIFQEQIVRTDTELLDLFSHVLMATPASIDNEHDTGRVLNEPMETVVNTIDIYKGSHFVQMCHNSSLSFMTSNAGNYFATTINLDGDDIYGDTVFLKIKNNKTVNLELDELLGFIVNFYFLKTQRLVDGRFREIGMPSFGPDIEATYKRYRTHKFIGHWIVFTDNSDSNIENLQESGNDVTKFNDLYFLMYKHDGSGEIYKALAEMKAENNRSGDLRGIFKDLDEEYIRDTFFS